MNRRNWLKLAGGAGVAGMLPGCAAQVAAAEKIHFSAVAGMGGEGYGIWQGGRRVAGRNLEHRLPSLSITKTVAALAVVRAADEGWLEIDRPLVDIIPEWRGRPGESRITVRMLVNLTAGFPAGVAALYRGVIADKGRVAVGLPLVNPPGTQFRYGPACDEVLAEVLRRYLVRGGSTTEKFVEAILGRIGISSPKWRRDGGGRMYLSTGAEFNVRDLGTLGRTVAKLAAGNDTAGLKGEIFKDLASPRVANPMMAAGMWWNRNANRSGAFSVPPERNIDAPRPTGFWQQACLATGCDPGWLAMIGSGGKRVYVLPERELVIARIGRDRDWSDAAFLQAVTR